MKMIVNIFEDIVADMRTTGAITALSETGGVTTVTTVNTLSADDYVTIGSTIYKLLTATSANFTVTGTGITATIWTANDLYYLPGHPKEISDILTERDKDKNLKFQKYPLIVLFTDIRIKSGDPKFYGELTGLDMAIIGSSEKTYSTTQRYDNVITPTLYPLLNTLIKKIQKSRYFTGTTPRLEYERFERPFWGSTQKYGNVANMFNDPLDAIELHNIKMKIKEGNICLT